jgi:hypothetical protein
MDLPFISAQNYKAVCEVMSRDLPDSYDEWLKLSAKWEIEEISEGGTVRKIEIDPDEFARFLRATGRANDMNALLIFTESIGKGERYR